MREKISISYLVILSLLVNYISGHVNSVCYYDLHDGELEKLEDKWKRGNCSATIETCDSIKNKTIDKKTDCDTFVSKSWYELFDRNNIRYKEKFEIRLEREKDVSFFHVIISDIQFRKLRIRLENTYNKINDPKFYWQTIELPPGPKPQSISLFLRTWKQHNTLIQFYGEGSDYNFVRQYDTCPPVTNIPNEKKVFGYVDTTLVGKVHLYLQPLPEYLNITTYYVEFKYNTTCKERFNFTKGVMHKEIESIEKLESYHFSVTVTDADGKNPVVTIVANFYVGPSNMGIVIMIVKVVTIPIALFFVLWRMYVYWRDRGFGGMRKPNCLLVYRGTHDSHIDAVISLARYLEGCKIHVMIDIFDIPKETHQNPGHWCNKAFQKANVIVVVMSPPLDKSVVVTRSPYRCLDGYFDKLIHENRRSRDKKYVVVRFPYCEDDKPTEVSAVGVLKIPKQLRKLINEIHDMKYTELYGLPDTVNFVNSLKSTQKSILNGTHDHKPNCLDELADMIFPRMDEMQIDQESESDQDTSNFITRDLSTHKIKPSTDIRTLDL